VVQETEQQDLTEPCGPRERSRSEAPGRPGELTERLDRLLALLTEEQAEQPAVEEGNRQSDSNPPDIFQLVQQKIERLDELVTLLAELDAQRDAFREERRQWELERAKAETELAARAKALEARRAELDARWARASNSAPATVPVSKEAEQDQSIREYMAALLERVRELADESTQPSTPTQTVGRKPGRRAAQTVGPARADSTLRAGARRTPESKQRGPVEICPRAAPPETAADLSAMRELANFTARSAICRHARRTLTCEICGKLLVTTVGLTAGVGLTWLWRAYGLGNLLTCAAAVGFLVAAYWGFQSIALAVCMRASKVEPPVDIAKNVKEDHPQSGDDAGSPQ